MGVPDRLTPSIVDEVRAVASVLPDPKVFLGSEATAEQLQRRGGESRFVHIATHGLFRRDNPMFSSIRLGDGLLWCDLYQLRLSAELRHAQRLRHRRASSSAETNRSDSCAGFIRGRSCGVAHTLGRLRHQYSGVHEGILWTLATRLEQGASRSRRDVRASRASRSSILLGAVRPDRKRRRALTGPAARKRGGKRAGA